MTTKSAADFDGLNESAIQTFIWPSFFYFYFIFYFSCCFSFFFICIGTCTSACGSTQAAALKTSNSVSYHSTQYSITHQISLLNLHKYSTSFDLLTTTAFATIESNSTITVIGLSTGRVGNRRGEGGGHGWRRKVGNRGGVWQRKESELLSIFVAK